VAKCDSTYLAYSIEIRKMIEDSVWEALVVYYSGQEINISTFNTGLYIIEIPESNIGQKFIKL
jgi:hypothetical protein